MVVLLGESGKLYAVPDDLLTQMRVLIAPEGECLRGQEIDTSSLVRDIRETTEADDAPSTVGLFTLFQDSFSIVAMAFRLGG